MRKPERLCIYVHTHICNIYHICLWIYILYLSIVYGRARERPQTGAQRDDQSHWYRRTPFSLRMHLHFLLWLLRPLVNCVSFYLSCKWAHTEVLTWTLGSRVLGNEPAMAHLHVQPKELKTRVHTACTRRPTAVLFVTARSWMQPRCPTTGDGVQKCGLSVWWGVIQP